MRSLRRKVINFILLVFILLLVTNQVWGMQSELSDTLKALLKDNTEDDFRSEILIQDQTPQEIAQKAFKSTVLLVMEDSNSQPISLGSGFFVSDVEVASNLHVVEGAARGYARILDQKQNYNIEGFTAIDLERDLVVLRISGIRASNLPLGNSNNVQVGETVYAVGNPQGLEGTFSQGIVSSIRQIGDNKLLQITAPISPGSSGGPVINTRGEVIGVSFASFSDGQNLNFAIPSNYLKTLVETSGSIKPLAQAKPVKAQKSIASDFGRPSTEGIVGDQLIWTYPRIQYGAYSFSLQNKLRESVKNIRCLVIFYDEKENPIDVNHVFYSGTIPAGLAKRVTSNVDGSVQALTTSIGSLTPKTKVEFRILDFEIVN
jgi:S1-C subfamily serine protease